LSLEERQPRPGRSQKRAAGDDGVVERLGERFSALPSGPWSDPPHTAVVLAIPSNKAHEPAGLLVAGVSPRLRLDESYRSFFELLRTQLATAIANARAYEEERRRPRRWPRSTSPRRRSSATSATSSARR
jgi:GAF domain-containing protein